MRSIGTRLDRMERAIVVSNLAPRIYSPEERLLYKEAARRRVRIFLTERGTVIRTAEEEEALNRQIVAEIQAEVKEVAR